MTTLSTLRKLDDLRTFLEWLEAQAKYGAAPSIATGEILAKMDLYGIIDHIGPKTPATGQPAAKKCPPHEWCESWSALTRTCRVWDCRKFQVRTDPERPWPSE